MLLPGVLACTAQRGAGGRPSLVCSYALATDCPVLMLRMVLPDALVLTLRVVLRSVPGAQTEVVQILEDTMELDVSDADAQGSHLTYMAIRISLWPMFGADRWLVLRTGATRCTWPVCTGTTSSYARSSTCRRCFAAISLRRPAIFLCRPAISLRLPLCWPQLSP